MVNAKTDDGLMSCGAYARHRGVSKQRISRLKREGRLPMRDGKVDVRAADELLGPVKPYPDVGRRERPQEPLTLDGMGQPPDYAMSRAWREYYEAEKARIALGRAKEAPTAEPEERTPELPDDAERTRELAAVLAPMLAQEDDALREALVDAGWTPPPEPGEPMGPRSVPDPEPDPAAVAEHAEARARIDSVWPPKGIASELQEPGPSPYTPAQRERIRRWAAADDGQVHWTGLASPVEE